jgi:hypothetical protein
LTTSQNCWTLPTAGEAGADTAVEAGPDAPAVAGDEFPPQALAVPTKDTATVNANNRRLGEIMNRILPDPRSAVKPSPGRIPYKRTLIV